MSELSSMQPTTDRSAIPPGQFESLAELRVAHSNLLETLHAASGNKANAAIRTFLQRAQAAGVFIQDDDERQEAQYILDYWTAELVSSQDETNIRRVRLADPDKTRSRDPDNLRVAEINLEQKREEARQLVRLAAAARNWQDSHRDPSYLYDGDALAQAARFRKADAAIGEFVEASERARDDQKRVRKKIALTALAVICALICTLAALQFQGLPHFRDWAIGKIKDQSDYRNGLLRMLGWFQPWLPLYEFTGTTVTLKGIRRPELNLYAPNFSRVKFSNVHLTTGQLAHAVFSNSTIENSSFAGTVLKSSQFREARISLTSFAGATLYRVVFDRAFFDRVNFSGADLSGATFWGASFGDKLELGFTNTPWWLAEGWNSCQIKGLQRARQETSALKQMKAFRDDIRKVSQFFERTDPGTLARAQALNDFAWTLAVWGVDLDRANSGVQKAEPNCLEATDMPDNAREAAKRAVCIAEKLRERSQDKTSPPWELAAFQDTYGYVLLQTRQYPDALSNLERAAAVLKSEGEVLFRLAVANYALGNGDKASSNLEASVKLRYSPGHELWTLRDQINDQILKMNDSIWPTPATTKPCRISGE